MVVHHWSHEGVSLSNRGLIVNVFDPRLQVQSLFRNLVQDVKALILDWFFIIPVWWAIECFYFIQDSSVDYCLIAICWYSCHVTVSYSFPKLLPHSCTSFTKLLIIWSLVAFSRSVGPESSLSWLLKHLSLWSYSWLGSLFRMACSSISSLI